MQNAILSMSKTSTEQYIKYICFIGFILTISQHPNLLMLRKLFQILKMFSEYACLSPHCSSVILHSFWMPVVAICLISYKSAEVSIVTNVFVPTLIWLEGFYGFNNPFCMLYFYPGLFAPPNKGSLLHIMWIQCWEITSSPRHPLDSSNCILSSD